jgi:arachidonate 5-lipoxygenase
VNPSPYQLPQHVSEDRRRAREETAISQWHEDAEFGRQRLTGVNPMKVQLLREDEQTPLWEAGDVVLKSQAPSYSMRELFRKGRLFYTEYSVLAHPRIQEQVSKGAYLAAPTCLFWANDSGHLMPLAIQLKPQGIKEHNPVFSPIGPRYDWLFARAHAQSADTHVHEGTYHLLETHLVSGMVALAMYRQLHPDHPLRQILEPHYEENLAINKLAIDGLLGKGGFIDATFAASAAGTLDAARLFYHGWDFGERSFRNDLGARGLDDKDTLPFHYYREDGLAVYEAIEGYVSSVLGLWYRTDDDVQRDTELQGWVSEVASPDGGAIPGFPAAIRTRSELRALVADLVFRAGPQHAAINNGQYDAYGWVPNSPARLRTPPPEEPSPPGGHLSEDAFWAALPDWYPATSQVSIVWVLSAPTQRTLLHAGECPALHPSLCPEAEGIVVGFRRRLHTLSQSIRRRNQRLDVPYRFLDPLNISRSTDI